MLQLVLLLLFSLNYYLPQEQSWKVLDIYLRKKYDYIIKEQTDDEFVLKINTLHILVIADLKLSYKNKSYQCYKKMLRH